MQDDIIVVDRGFRDCLQLLEDIGLIYKIPSFINMQKQLPTEEANSTRLVIKIRWVVEAVNARMKHWKALDNVVPNVQIPHIGNYVRIICALINAFHLSRVHNTEDDEIIAERMLTLSNFPNLLQ